MSDAQRYEFRWRVSAHVDEVAAVLAELAEFARWWPAGWSEAVEAAPGAASGVGRIVSVRTRGASPLTLDWSARCVASGGDAWAWDLFGDLEGTLHIRAVADGEGARVTFAWHVALEKPATRGVPLAQRALATDLAWMMARGEESLRLELARRASHEVEGAPPGPRARSALPLTLAGVGVVAAVAGLLGLLLRRTR
jgi:hypothetical protein